MHHGIKANRKDSAWCCRQYPQTWKKTFCCTLFLNDGLNVREIEQTHRILLGNQGGWEDECPSLAKFLMSWVYGDVFLWSFFMFWFFSYPSYSILVYLSPLKESLFLLFVPKPKPMDTETESQKYFRKSSWDVLRNIIRDKAKRCQWGSSSLTSQMLGIGSLNKKVPTRSLDGENLGDGEKTLWNASKVFKGQIWVSSDVWWMCCWVIGKNNNMEFWSVWNAAFDCCWSTLIHNVIRMSWGKTIIRKTVASPHHLSHQVSDVSMHQYAYVYSKHPGCVLTLHYRILALNPAL